MNSHLNDFQISRRGFLGQCGMGFGLSALAPLLNPFAGYGKGIDPMAPRGPHFAPKAKRVIHLFMNGGPSHMDTFDPKPELNKWHGKLLPEENRFKTERKTGAAFGYLLFGPFTICGPLRNTEYQQSAGLLAAIGAVHILSLLFLLYNQPGKQPNIPPSDVTVEAPPSDLFTRTGWSDFTSGFWLGGCGGAVFAWFLCSTVHVQELFKIAAGVWSVS